MNRYEELQGYLKTLGSACVCFSGGEDSAFLLKCCADALGKSAAAVTVDAPWVPRQALAQAVQTAHALGVKHVVLHMEPSGLPEDAWDGKGFAGKRALYACICTYAQQNGYAAVLDGTTLDDTRTFCPGCRAAARLGVFSPLEDLTAGDIRAMARMIGMGSRMQTDGAQKEARRLAGVR